jgi:hypothetical protein
LTIGTAPQNDWKPCSRIEVVADPAHYSIGCGFESLAMTGCCNFCLSARTGKWMGVMGMPWVVNLMLLLDDGNSFRACSLDECQAWRFPCTLREFMGSRDEDLEHEQYSLFAHLRRGFPGRPS